MKNYIKAELFRQRFAKSHFLVLGFTILFPVFFSFFMKFILQYQDVVFLGNHFLYLMYMYLLVGFYLIYPIVVCANAVKPKYILRQLITSQISKRDLFNSDIIYTSFLNICYIFLHLISSLLCATLFFDIDNSRVNISDSITTENFIAMISVIALTTILANILLYSLQVILENKVLSTGMFIFVIYILPLLVAQLRNFSPNLEKISFFIPFLQVLLYYKHETSVLNVLLVHAVILTIIYCLTICLYGKKEE